MRGGFGNSRRSNITINNGIPCTTNTQKPPDVMNNFYIGGTRDFYSPHMTNYPKRNCFGRGGSGTGVAEYSSSGGSRGSFRGAFFGVETESRQQARRPPVSFTDHSISSVSKFSKSAVEQPSFCTDESYYTKRDYENFVNDHHREPIRGGRSKFSNSTGGDFSGGGMAQSNVDSVAFFRKRSDMEESTKVAKSFLGQQRTYYEQIKKDIPKFEKTTMMPEVSSTREKETTFQGNKLINSGGGFGRGRRGLPQQQVVAKLNRNKELIDSFVPKNISDVDAMIYSKEDIQKMLKDSQKEINYNMLFSPILADVKDPSSKDVFPILLEHFDVLSDGTLKLKRIVSKVDVKKKEEKDHSSETIGVSVSLKKSLSCESAEVALMLKSLVENALNVTKNVVEVENYTAVESSTAEKVGDEVVDVDPIEVSPIPDDEMNYTVESALNALPEKEERTSMENDALKEQATRLPLEQKCVEYLIEEFRLLLKKESIKLDKENLKENKELIKENVRLCERIKEVEEKNKRLESHSIQLEKKLKLASDFCSSFLSKLNSTVFE